MIIKNMSNEEVNHRFARLSGEHLDRIASHVLDDCYNRTLCRELGIDYCDIRVIDMMRIYVHHAYINGILKEG
jgi:hypothetical protein